MGAAFRPGIAKTYLRKRSTARRAPSAPPLRPKVPLPGILPRDRLPTTALSRETRQARPGSSTWMPPTKQYSDPGLLECAASRKSQPLHCPGIDIQLAGVSQNVLVQDTLSNKGGYARKDFKLPEYPVNDYLRDRKHAVDDNQQSVKERSCRQAGSDLSPINVAQLVRRDRPRQLQPARGRAMRRNFDSFPVWSSPFQFM